MKRNVPMIKLLIMDVDGTLTDGMIYMASSGEAMKAFNIKDGYAIAHMLPEMGVVPVIITGRRSRIVENRAKELGIAELHQGVTDKLGKLKEVAEKFNAASYEIAYIGDDLNDLDCLQYCGLTGCPADAVEEVKQTADYTASAIAGSGAVREFIEFIRSKTV